MTTIAMNTAPYPPPLEPNLSVLASLLDQAPVPSFILSLDGVILYSNTPGAALIGRPGAGCSGLRLDQMLCAEDLEEARWLAEGLAEGCRSAYRAEHRFVDANRRRFWVDISLSLFRDSVGEPQYLWLQAIDINAQKETDRALAESEQRWNFALESAGQGVWEADLRQGTVFYSPTWKKLRGYEPDEMIESSQQAWLERVHLSDRDRVRSHISRADQLPRKVFEYRERHKLGHYIWIQSRGAPVEFDAEGRPVRIIGTDTDVTELKRAEARSDGLSKRLELALSISKIGVFELDIGTGRVFYDARLREIFGISEAQEVITREDFERALHPEDREHVLAANAKAIQDRGGFTSRYRILDAAGQVRILTSHATYFEDEDGVPKLIGTNWDISEDVALQEKLLSANQLAEVRYAELEAIKAKLEKQALLDALTGLPNRRYLEDVLKQLAREDEAALAILHIDLDRFKQINDTRGHLVGDLVLKHVADILRRLVTPLGLVARVGGDEFVVVCPQLTDRDRLAELARRIAHELQQPFQHEGNIVPMGASIGVAIQAGSALDEAKLLFGADAALYRAKAGGRGGYAFYTDALRAEIELANRTAEQLAAAVDARQFVPHYQAVVDAKTLELVGVEALARWSHPEQGILGPVHFLKAAEDLHVLETIDGFILDQAIADFQAWHQDGLVVPSVSVNVSYKRLKNDRLLASLRHLSFAPGTVSFELLESIFLDDDDDDLGVNLEGIRRLGIGIDIDDFGTGHTSFLSLFRLKPRRFKIDRRLISPIVQSREKRSIVRAIIGIGKTLNIKVVAEGVETFEHAEILRRLGCDYLQGYAISEPLSSAAFRDWYANHGSNRRMEWPNRIQRA